MRHFLLLALAVPSLPVSVLEPATAFALVAGAGLADRACAHQDGAGRAIALADVAGAAHRGPRHAQRTPNRPPRVQFAVQLALRMVRAAKLDKEASMCGNLRRKPHMRAGTDRPRVPSAKTVTWACPGCGGAHGAAKRCERQKAR